MFIHKCWNYWRLVSGISWETKAPFIFETFQAFYIHKHLYYRLHERSYHYLGCCLYNILDWNVTI